MKKTLFFGIILLFMVGVQAQTIPLPTLYPDTIPNLTPFNPTYSQPYWGCISTNLGEVCPKKSFDTLNLVSLNQNFRIIPENKTNTYYFDVKPTWNNLPIFQGGMKNGLAFGLKEFPNDYSFHCLFNGVCELSLNNKYGFKATFSQDNDDLAIVTNASHITLGSKNYVLELPEETPFVGACLKVVEFISNKTYKTGWRAC